MLFNGNFYSASNQVKTMNGIHANNCNNHGSINNRMNGSVVFNPSSMANGHGLAHHHPHHASFPSPSSAWPQQATTRRFDSHARQNGWSSKNKQQNGVGTPTALKLVMVGLGGVGKSSLTIQFVQQYFLDRYDPTISDSYTKKCFVDDALYQVEVVDTAGQEEYSAMREQHLRTGDGFLLAFSVTNRQSLEYVLRLRKSIVRLKDREHFPMLLVGNKCDLDSHRQVSSAEAEDLAACFQIPYIECSAKFRQNVDQLFHTLIRQIRQFRYLERRTNGNTTAALENGCSNTVMDHADWGMRNGGHSINKQQQNGIRKKGKKEKDKGRNCKIQ